MIISIKALKKAQRLDDRQLDSLFKLLLTELGFQRLLQSFHCRHLTRIGFAMSLFDAGEDIHTATRIGFWRSSTSVELYARNSITVPALVRFPRWPMRAPLCLGVGVCMSVLVAAVERGSIHLD